MGRRFGLLSILLLLIFGNTPILGQAQTEEPWTFTILESNDQQLLIELSLPSFSTETITHDGQLYQRLHVADWGYWGEPGQPELPAYSAFVGMPRAGEPQISIVKIQEEILAGYHLYPRPDFVEGNTPHGLDLVEAFAFDAEAYRRDISYPGVSAEAVDKGILRDQPLFRLKIYPFQYNPVRQELRVARRIQLLITFPIAPISGSSIIEGTSPAFRNILKNTLVNYEDLPQSTAPTTNDSIQGASLSGANYLIITHPNFYDAVQELKTYRESQGMNVFVKKTDEIYNEFSGGIKSPEAIHDFIENAYNTWNPKPEYVLLVGDANADAVITNPDNHREIAGYNPNISTDYLPSHYEATLGFIDSVGPTPIDAWYAKLNGIDPYFDIIIGRIPARKSSDISTVIAKIKAYEQTPQAGDWARKAVLVADDGKNEAEGEQFRGDMNLMADHLPSSIQTTKLFNYTPGVSVAQEIDTGVLLLAYSGHGNKNSWSSWEGDSQVIYKKSNISSLSNENKLPIVIAANCANGYFAAPDTARVLAEEFLLVSNKGSIAALASAAFSYPSVNSMMIETISETIFKDNDLIMGSAATTARLKAINNDEEFNPPNNLFELFTYFGDPALRLNLPPTLTLTGQASSNVVTAGEMITYQLNYSVSGANQSRSLTLVNTLPDHVTYQSASTPPSSIDGQKLTWNLGDVANSNGGVTITAVVDKIGLLDGQTISNEARLSDWHGGDKTVHLDTEVVVNDIPPDIALITSSSPDQVGQTTQFTISMAQGTNLSYAWNFGDNTTGNVKNPGHTYATPGTYTATLTASNGVGNDQSSIQVKIKGPDEPIDQPVAGFSSSSPDQLGQTTVFINTAQDGGSLSVGYIWSFGDGTTSDEMHPLHTYEADGSYPVSLTITNTVGSDTFTDTVLIEPLPYNKFYLPLLLKN